MSRFSVAVFTANLPTDLPSVTSSVMLREWTLEPAVARAALKGREQWFTVHRAIRDAGVDPSQHRARMSFFAQCPNSPDEWRKEYYNQPTMLATRAIDERSLSDKDSAILMSCVDYMGFCISALVPPFAYVTLDGEWRVASNPVDRFTSYMSYARKVKASHPDGYVTMVDCRI